MSREETKQAKKSYKQFSKNNTLVKQVKDYTINQINSYNKGIRTLNIKTLITN